MATGIVTRTAVGESLTPFVTDETIGNSVQPFGAASPSKDVYPNDSILFEIYNFTNDYLETVYRPVAYTTDNLNVVINAEEILRQQRYFSGKYNVRTRFLRNHLGSGDGNKLTIQEISADRLEVRVVPTVLAGSPDSVVTAFENAFATSFFQISKSDVLPNLFLFKNTFDYYKVFDYVQDPFTVDTYPYSIILKLAAPLPLTIRVDDLFWLAQEVSAPIQDSVTVIPPKPEVNYTYIASPNFDVVSDKITNNSTDFKNWDDVLSTNTDTSLNIIQKLFSGSLIEGVPLNVDFRRFENFVHFGSAEERLKNFKYKLELIEYYDSRIQALSQSYSTIPAYNANSSLTGSEYFVNNVLDAKRKRNALLGGFDNYENYLYYQSSSYENNTFGEFYPTTWPKQNSTKPYILYSTTSSQATEWFDGIIASASVYDLNNQNSLRQLIPEHVYNVPSNDQYILFIDMMGHYFDLLYQYIKQLTSIHERYEAITEGFAKDLVYTIGQSLGLNMENGHQMDDLWTYLLGVTQNGSLISPTYGISTEDKTKEIWKRIITNLPYLLKTKGTSRGIRALVNCYGIPSTILRVKEYGGPEPDFTSATQLEYDQFYYGLLVSGSSQTISVPISNWQDANGTTGTYGALELRFRLDTTILTSSVSYNLLTGPIAISLNPNAGTITIGSQTINVPLNEDDTDWWTVLVNGGLRAYVGANRYGKALIYSSSASPGSIASSNATIGGIYGVVNEFRLWKSNIDLDVFENHILAPTSFQGPLDGRFVGSTSSFDSLKVRHTFGSDGKRYDASTTTIISVHPDQNSLTYQGGGQRSATFTGYTSDTASYWIPQTETHYLEYVDGGANRNVGNKVRIETDVLIADEQLSREGTIQDSLQDLYPVDSPRVSVAFSPTDEVNEDISEQFGGLNLDDFLGDPADYYRNEYSTLNALKNEYFKKYKKRNNVQAFIRLTQNYDASLFQLIKQFVPERAVLHTGVAVESHILHRNKVGWYQPSYEDQTYETDLDLLRQPIGRVQDMDGDERVPGGYVFNTEVSRSYSTDGSTVYYEGETERVVDTTTLDLSQTTIMSGDGISALSDVVGALNQYNNASVLTLEDGATDLDFSAPSQYMFNTWYQTGSGDSDWRLLPSIGADYFEAIQPNYQQNRLSDIYTSYVDRFSGLFSNRKLALLYNAGATRAASVLTTYGIPTTATIIKSNTQYYIQSAPAGGVGVSISITLSRCFEPDNYYRIRGGAAIDGTDPISFSIQAVSGSTIQTIYQQTTAGGGSYLPNEIGFNLESKIQTSLQNLRFNVTYESSATGTVIQLKQLKVEKIVKPEIQDSDMLWAGRRSSYYNGVKMTSADFNIDSLDTIDGGPVVLVNTVDQRIVSSTPSPINPSNLD